VKDFSEIVEEIKGRSSERGGTCSQLRKLYIRNCTKIKFAVISSSSSYKDWAC
jgi:hypothetical protein